MNHWQELEHSSETCSLNDSTAKYESVVAIVMIEQFSYSMHVMTIYIYSTVGMLFRGFKWINKTSKNQRRIRAQL